MHVPCRTARMLFTLGLRLRKHTGKLGSFHAWNKCLNHVLALANAYIEGVLYRCFMTGVENCHDKDSVKSLKAMADLFALRCIESDILFRWVATVDCKLAYLCPVHAYAYCACASITSQGA